MMIQKGLAGKNVLYSGDQSTIWDASLKLMLLNDAGYMVRHMVHTSDQFSRGPAGLHSVAATHEAYRPDGNVSRWTATFEASLFLGKMPITPSEFTAHGVDFGLIAQFRNQSLEKTVEHFTQGDWIGVSHHENRIAHGMSVNEVFSACMKVKKIMRQNLEESLEKEQIEHSMVSFNRMFNLELYEKHFWFSASKKLIEKDLQLRGVKTVSLTNTIREFQIRDYETPSLLFPLFINNYQAAYSIYNKVVSQNGSGSMHPLHFGELPFYAVVRQNKKLVRTDLSYHKGDTPRDILARVEASHGKVIVVLGKAIPYLVDMMLLGYIVLPEEGSPYASQSFRFAEMLRSKIGPSIRLHPVYRLKVHALDALDRVNVAFKLPEYLAKAFGTEWITGRDCAAQWKAVIHNAESELEELSGKDPFELIPKLKKEGLLADVTIEHIAHLRNLLERYSGLSRKTYESFIQENAEKLKGAGAREEVRKRTVLIERQFDPDIIRAELRMIAGAIDERRAEMMRERLLVKKSLSYWNMRPFTYWVDALPGWYESIRSKAELVPDPFFEKR